MNHQTIIVLDFGGQYNQLIARRVRECGVYCEVKPYTTPLADLLAMKPIGFIFTGGPNSVYLEDAPHVDPALFDAGVPVLGICYGCQLIAHHLGGKVVAANDATAREYGKTETFFDTNCKLFKGLPEKSVTWMSHGDYMEKVPEGFSLVAHSDACPNVAICDETRGFYGVQYHPEVNHTEFGTAMIRNFLYEVCGAKGDWTMGDYKNTAIAAVREKVGSGRVLLALSGGVDSSVVAALLAEAVGPQLTCVFVDHGLMRLNEGDEVEAAFKKWNINFVRVNAEGRFLSKLAGISDPERKRKIIGEEFIRVFEEESKKIGAVDFLAQGTIYPDVNIRITGRIKEIIVTSTGEKVPPADLESAITSDRLFSQCMVVGDDRPFIAAVAVVNPDEFKTVCGELGLDPAKPESLQDPAFRKAALKRIKTSTAGFPNYGVPRQVHCTLDAWTIDNGLLTPTLKMKRNLIRQRYTAEINALYDTLVKR